MYRFEANEKQTANEEHINNNMNNMKTVKRVQQF